MCEPREGHSSRCPDPGCLQRHPGAVRIAHGKPVQRIQPCVVGRAAIRAENAGDPRRHYTTVYAVESRDDGSPLGTRHHEMGERPGPHAALQRFSRIQGERQRRRRVQFGTIHTGDGSGSGRGASPRVYRCLVGARLRGEEIGRNVRRGVSFRSHHRIPRPCGPIRVLDAALLRNDGGALRNIGAL